MKRRKERGTEKAARVAFIETEMLRVEPESAAAAGKLVCS